MKNYKTIIVATLAFSAALAFTQPTISAAPGKADEKKATAKTVKPYPLDVCIVTENDLGSMGEETRIVYEGQEIKFCCKPCEKKFRKNPAKYLERLTPKTN